LSFVRRSIVQIEAIAAMKSFHLTILLLPTEAFTPSSQIQIHSITTSRLHNSISGNEKRTHRPSIAPLSPNTGAIGSAGPISNVYRRPSSSRRLQEQVVPTENRVTIQSSLTNDYEQLLSPAETNEQLLSLTEQSLRQKISHLQQTLKERDDDVEMLIYEVYRLQDISSQVKNANDQRSNDFTLLKKEAERLKLDFETRTKQNEEKMDRLVKRLQDREQTIIQLQNQLRQCSQTITELQNYGISSPSLGISSNRIPSRQYRATKSFEENKNAAVVGGAPILYRSQGVKQSLAAGYLADVPNSAELMNDVSVEIDVPIDEGVNFAERKGTSEDVVEPLITNDSSAIQEVRSTIDSSVNNRYPRPHGIGVGNKGMLEEEKDDENYWDNNSNLN
jgi:hypothetical protein